MRSRLRQLAGYPARILPFTWLSRVNSLPVFLPFYHAVSAESLPWLNPFYRVLRPEEFRADLEFLLKNFTPVGLDRVLSIATIERGNTTKGRPLMHLSFDDGLRCCREEIAPLLLEEGVPATFFVNPAFIGNRELFYRYKAGIILQRQPRLRKELLAMTHRNVGELDRLLEETGTDLSAWLDEERPFMDEEDLQWLAGKGFTVGSHSLDHPDFRLLDELERKNQVTASLEWLHRQCPQPLRVFSFPFTDANLPASFIRWLGTVCDLSFGSAGLKTDIIRTHLQRLAMDEPGSSSAKHIIKSRYFIFAIASIVGKKKISR